MRREKLVFHTCFDRGARIGIYRDGSRFPSHSSFPKPSAMSLTDRKSFLKASRKIKHPESTSGTGSDRYEVETTPVSVKGKKKKAKKRLLAEKIANPAKKAKKSDKPVDRPSGKRKKKSNRPVISDTDDEPSQPVDISAGEPESPPPLPPCPVPMDSSVSPETSAEKTDETVPASQKSGPMSPHAAEVPSTSGAGQISPHPAVPSTSSVTTSPKKRIVKRVRYQDSPPEPEPEMILDEVTGEMRQKRPDDFVEIMSGEDSDFDDDAAEDDDFYERDYPSGEEDDSSEDDENVVLVEASKEGSDWRLSEDGDVDIFTPPDFEHERGPVFTLPTHARELEYFYKYLTPDLIRLATRETNSYAVYHQRFIARKIDRHWKATRLIEMQAFLGMLVCMGVDRKSALEDYWSSDIFLRNIGISAVMTRARFQAIMRYFHLADAESDPRRDPDPVRRRRRCEEDPMYKVNPWMEPIVDKCVNNYQMGREISIDEGMVRFKGRSKFKQRLPHKPDRDGFKIWQLCDSATAYVANFAPYLGVKYKEAGEGKRQERGVVKRITMELVQPFCGYNHTLFCDSLFTTVVTARELMETGVYMVGSFNRRNRRSMPPS